MALTGKFMTLIRLAGRIKRRLIRTVKFNQWFLQSILSGHKRKKRPLAIWDFSSQPYSVGDIVLLNQLTVVLAKKLGESSVDIGIIANSENPCRDSFQKLGVNSYNYLDCISNLLPLFLAFTHVEGLYLFRDHLNAEAFIADNLDNYYVWPDIARYGAKEDLNLITFSVISDYYRESGHIPSLQFRQSLIDWADSFLFEKAASAIPIVVQIRNAGSYNQTRNSDMDAWCDFVKWCGTEYSVKFIVVCAFNEIDERLRTFNNVVIAKDYYTTVEQDLALIQRAQGFMGVSSGPSTVAMFGSKPYSIFNIHMDERYNNYNEYSWGCRFIFSSESQRLIYGKETVYLLKKEFVLLYESVIKSRSTNSMHVVNNEHPNLRLR